MKTTISTRLALALACLAAAAVPVAPAAASSAPSAPEGVVTQAFSADSGDSCRYGRARGVLGWRLPPLGGGPTAVTVEGTAQDLPLPHAPVIGCGDDGRFTTVAFVARAGSTIVDSELVRVDNAGRDIALTLAGDTAATRTDSVTVQVCRSHPATPRLDYCGPRVSYRAPIAVGSAGQVEVAALAAMAKAGHDAARGTIGNVRP
jgi:hypothetical protein